MKLAVAVLLAACSSPPAPRGPVEPPISEGEAECNAMNGPPVVPTDPTELARWRRLGQARQALLARVVPLLTTRDCAVLEQRLGPIFAGEQPLVRELDDLTRSSRSHFFRWAEVEFPGPPSGPDEAEGLRMCELQPVTKYGLNALLVYTSCTVQG